MGQILRGFRTILITAEKSLGWELFFFIISSYRLDAEKRNPRCLMPTTYITVSTTARSSACKLANSQLAVKKPQLMKIATCCLSISFMDFDPEKGTDRGNTELHGDTSRLIFWAYSALFWHMKQIWLSVAFPVLNLTVCRHYGMMTEPSSREVKMTSDCDQ